MKGLESTAYSGVWEQINPLQLVGQGHQAAEVKFESKFEPLTVIWQSLLHAIPEDNQRLDLVGQV